VTEGGYDLGIAFDGDGDRMLAVDGQGEAVDGDQILARARARPRRRLVAVTVMTNLGFHQLMGERGIEVVVTDVGDRYVLEALARRDGSSAASSPATSSTSATT
jgi:phosphoglucosamine mutase